MERADLTKISKKSSILNVNVGGGMNCLGSLASTPTPLGNPPIEASDRKTEKRRTEEAATNGTERTREYKVNTCSHTCQMV